MRVTEALGQTRTRIRAGRIYGRAAGLDEDEHGTEETRRPEKRGGYPAARRATEADGRKQAAGGMAAKT